MKDTVDLVPVEVRVLRAVQRRLFVSAGIGLTVLAGVLAAGVIVKGTAAGVDGDLVQLRQRIATMEDWTGRIAPLMDDLRKVRARKAAVRALADEPAWSETLSDIAQASGAGEIREISFVAEVETEGKPAQAPAIRVLGVARTAQDLLRFVNGLTASSHIEAPSLKKSRIMDDPRHPGQIEFELSATVRREPANAG